MYDYLIVGSGLAGISFAEIALQNNKSIYVVNNQSQNSSLIAAGLYNPVILKRFTEVWEAQNQLNFQDEFYSSLQIKLASQFDYKTPLLRKFYSVEEQNNWFIAADKPNLAPFLSTNLIPNKYHQIDAPLGYGEVLKTGFIDTYLLITTYINYLKSINSYQELDFQYSDLIVEIDFIQYQNIKAKHIVFAEGFGMLLNPFFDKFPLDGAKGELLLIKAPNLNLDVIVKTSIFIIPFGNDLYKVGATYNWIDKTNNPTDDAKNELITELKDLIKCDFEIVEHYAGIRPTVKDRRPLLGVHPNFKNLFLLNGMGTRGVMLAPSMAKMLFEFIENNEPLHPQVNINRFKKIYSSFY
jgi:glycine/D-amino acid oxidase-like deaminating enzyme